MRATIQFIEQELTGLYPNTEIRAFTRLIIEHACQLDFTSQIMLQDYEIGPSQKDLVYDIVERLKVFEPLQYITGETEFHGLKLKVRPGVLIPRPETEELVDWVTKTRLPLKPVIMDIGTGSGCIALALKKLVPGARVSAVDVSEKALSVAHENALINRLRVKLILADILDWEEFSWKNCNVLVSNPPYVRESEKKLMDPNVLNFEPATALFVPDSDPLLYYRRISEWAQKYLLRGGWLFFEINEQLADDMMNLVDDLGFHAVEIKKDLSGRNRMLRCRR